MKILQRKEAENLFSTLKVVSTRVEQNDHEIVVHFLFENKKGFILKYNIRNRQKSYFLLDSAPSS